jgi:hypothetical protein
MEIVMISCIMEAETAMLVLTCGTGLVLPAICGLGPPSGGLVLCNGIEICWTREGIN